MRVLKGSTRIPFYFLSPANCEGEVLTPYLCKKGMDDVNVLSADTSLIGEPEGVVITALLDFSHVDILGGFYVLEVRNITDRVIASGVIYVYEY